jgi:hypothetical protein
MNPSCTSDEFRLIDMVSGLLSAEEKERTIDHVRGCPDCEQRLREIVADREHLRAAPFPRMVHDRIQRVQPGNQPALRRWLAMAAVLAVVVIGTLRVFTPRNSLEYWIPVEEASVVLRSDGQASGAMEDGLKAYRNRDVGAAIELLEDLVISSGDQTAATLRDLYLASALVNAERHAEALATLEKLRIDSMPTPWRGHAQWVQYIALTRAGRDLEARALIETLALDPGEMGRRAQAELDRLK